MVAIDRNETSKISNRYTTAQSRRFSQSINQVKYFIVAIALISAATSSTRRLLHRYAVQRNLPRQATTGVRLLISGTVYFRIKATAGRSMP